MNHEHHYLHMLMCLAMVGAVFFLARKDTSTIPTSQPEVAIDAILEEKRGEAGDVTIIVQPQQTTDSIVFALTFDTHSGELDFDAANAVVLIDANGKEIAPREWSGDPSGGHHRKITVIFAPVAAPNITLAVRNVGGVPERVFTWKR